VNFNFCLGVRSACLITVTTPFNFHECLELGIGAASCDSWVGALVSGATSASGAERDGGGRISLSIPVGWIMAGELLSKVGGELIGVVIVDIFGEPEWPEV